jgi:prepilin-type N-terminal cleavage/methylation domain-containing protein
MNTGQRGYTLVEVLISTVLMAVVVGAVFKLALTSASSSGNADRRLVANQYSRHLSELLSAYVTGDHSGVTGGYVGGKLIGPSNGTTNPNAWSLQGLTGDNGTVTDSMGAGVWALAPGTHQLRYFLPGWFEAAPYNATISYCIAGPGVSCCDAAAGYSCPTTNSYSVTGGTVSLANINVTWNDP